jgi:ZIP family zinc transporter
MDTFAVFVVALGTALATGLGALPFFFGRPDRSWLGVANSLASGFMLGAAAGLCYEGAQYGVGRTAAGVAAGVVFISVSERIMGGRGRELHLGSLQGADARRALMIVGAMTLHSFAEGVGVGVAFGVEETFGVLIGIAIAVHNIPEGLAISLVLLPRGTSPRTAAAWSIFSSLPQPLMAVPAFLFVETFAEVLPIGLGFAAGAMVWLVVADLLPEALTTSRRWIVTLTVLASALSMLVFMLLLL